MTKKVFRILTIAYIITLGVVLGAGLYAGVVVAPTLFNSEVLLGSEILSNYQEGILMTQNFERLAYMVNFMVLFVILYEVIKWKSFESDRWTFIATFLVVATGLLFSSYYVPDIVAMQLAGEAMTQSDAFLNTHKGSELDFKIFTFATLALLILNLKKALR
ncbi:MAG: DUF4149 domain-containing protein [Epsilonproteobacteria bacterium]|nr:DUF4149 domain-containing protein [Campylobacterota bacterium]